jgi:hypothetical protein
MTMTQPRHGGSEGSRRTKDFLTEVGARQRVVVFSDCTIPVPYYIPVVSRCAAALLRVHHVARLWCSINDEEVLLKTKILSRNQRTIFLTSVVRVTSCVFCYFIFLTAAWLGEVEYYVGRQGGRVEREMKKGCENGFSTT